MNDRSSQNGILDPLFKGLISLQTALSDARGIVALRDRRACWIVVGGGTIQIASWSSSIAIASRNTGDTSTPSS